MKMISSIQLIFTVSININKLLTPFKVSKFKPTNPKSMKHSSNNELEEAHTVVHKQKQIIWF